MSTKNIACLTWNLELQCPDNQALTEVVAWIKEMPYNERPDIIVIGLQEAASYGAIGSSSFIGEKLMENSFFSKFYTLVGSTHFRGITKANQLAKKKAQQAIQVIVKNDSLPHTNVSFSTHSKGTISEKGFCIADVTFHNKRMGFVSTHLDAGSEDKRTKECIKIREKLSKGVMGAQKYNALFMMGDLNYRMQRMNPAAPAALETSNILAQLTTRAGIRSIQTYDSFKEATCFNQLPFIWPDHSDNCMPTYKREKNKSAYPAIRKLKGFLDDSKRPSGRPVHQPNLLGTIYAPGNSFKEKRAGVWDFGWLDRIGYAVYEQSHYNPKGNLGLLGTGLRISTRQKKVIELNGLAHVPYGDHTPVVCNFEVSGF